MSERPYTGDNGTQRDMEFVNFWEDIDAGRNTIVIREGRNSLSFF